MTGVRVNLTWPELLLAANVGVYRTVQNLRLGRKDRFGADPENRWTLSIEGAAGEMAVAKAMDLFWSGAIGDLKADDVGALQVRTRSRHEYELPLHPTDLDDRIFILVTGRAPQFWVRGWIFADDGKRSEWWADPSGKNRPAFFVPHSELRDMADLPDDARAEAWNASLKPVPVEA
jgi:hypothetical protein